MIKAIFFDVDGTLLSFKTHQMADSTRQALLKLKEKGIKIFISTGRSPQAFELIYDRLGVDFDGFVYNNGQQVVVDGKMIRDQALPIKDLRVLVDYIEKKKIATSFTEANYSYVNIINDRIKKLADLMGRTLDEDKIDSPKRIETNVTYQLAAYIYQEEEEEFFTAVPNLRGVRWHPLFIDVIPKDGGKAVGIKTVLDYFGIKKEETMAFGDGGNDTEMLAYVEYGIAMGNAVYSAKEVSKFVTADVDDDGIYKALIKYGVI
ncbi:MAG: Cof-type HAD-IIB family hydrolase [Tissierellia bacterium]|nr:Cof-type HAD-IIB family hydrolase [Tissierellia bacterium]